MKKRLFLILALVALLGAGCVSIETSPTPSSREGGAKKGTESLRNLTVEERTASSTRFLVFTQAHPDMRFTLTRPDADDARILLAVPGTYTSPADTPEGFVVLDGKIIQEKERQGWDGAALFADGRVDILQTNGGKKLTRAYLADVAANGASLLQAHLLVKDGAPQHFKDQPETFRRALAVTADGAPAIVESGAMLDLNAFAVLLAALGARDAVNLDMGTWSEGWYRGADGRRVTLGFPNQNTARQSNWIIFHE